MQAVWRLLGLIVLALACDSVAAIRESGSAASLSASTDDPHNHADIWRDMAAHLRERLGSAPTPSRADPLMLTDENSSSDYGVEESASSEESASMEQLSLNANNGTTATPPAPSPAPSNSTKQPSEEEIAKHKAAQAAAMERRKAELKKQADKEKADELKRQEAIRKARAAFAKREAEAARAKKAQADRAKAKTAKPTKHPKPHKPINGTNSGNSTSKRSGPATHTTVVGSGSSKVKAAKSKASSSNKKKQVKRIQPATAKPNSATASDCKFLNCTKSLGPDGVCQKKGREALCVCKKGYIIHLQTGKCRKSKPCDFIRCDGQFETCANVNDKKGSCVCKKGYFRNVKSNLCQEDPCAVMPPPCDSSATCRRKDGKAVCVCAKGYKPLSARACEPNDACVLNKPPMYCHANATCVTQGPKHTCKCNAGFRGDGQSVCLEIDACKGKKNPCPANSECARHPTTPGSFVCNCLPGFELNKGACQRKNPCKPNPCAAHARCFDEGEGDYRCVCNLRYQGDGKISCTPVDRCKQQPYPCDKNADCTMVGTVPRCTCKHGFWQDGVVCRAVNPCSSALVCGDNAECISDAKDKKGYRCKCLPGFAQKVGIAKFECVYDNPCDNKPCSANATCTAQGAAFSCQCLVGFSGNANSKGADGCKAIASCKGNPCAKHAICTDTAPGKYSCKCKTGYRGDGKASCEEINPCHNAIAPCGKNAICTYTGPGQSKCSCPQGYRGNAALRCDEINACASDTIACPQFSTCVRTGPGTRKCQCNTGYTEKKKTNGTVCESINPCAINANLCHAQATCKHTGPNKHSCTCKPGYAGDGKTCKRVFACDKKPCHAFGNCTDTATGGFTCACLKGFSGDGIKKCDPINNCKQPKTCDADTQICQMTGPGTHTCTCKPGYKPNGVKCAVIDLCAEAIAKSSPLCGEGSQCVQDKPGHTFCKCEAGFYPKPGQEVTQQECLRKNPCEGADTAKLCGTGAFIRCVNNKPGSFECRCPENSHFDRVPTSSAGFFQCTCKQNYELSGDICVAKPSL